MRPYSDDLRIRIIGAIERGEESWRQIARRFVVHVSFVIRLVRSYRETGTVQPRPHGGGRKPALGSEQLERLRALLRDRPDATLEELRQALGASCSTMAIVRALKKLGLTRKKKVLHAAERDTPKNQRKRATFRRKMKGHSPGSLVFVDETSANTAMTRAYGRAPVGERVEGAVPNHWETVTLICGLRLSGVTAPLVIPGAVDTAAFETYVEDVLAPQLRPGDVVVWDNINPHKATAAVKAVGRMGAKVVPLPPVSPDLDPIEEMFSKVKGALRSAGARTSEAVIEAIGSALRQISPRDILGWFNSRASYAMQT
jgi:transposase